MSEEKKEQNLESTEELIYSDDEIYEYSKEEDLIIKSYIYDDNTKRYFIKTEIPESSFCSKYRFELITSPPENESVLVENLLDFANDIIFDGSTDQNILQFLESTDDLTAVMGNLSLNEIDSSLDEDL